MVLRGIGIGTGAAIGPVLRMPEPGPAPASPSPAGGPPSGTPVEELERVLGALAAVSEHLAARAATVDGESRAVLEAIGMMTRDPAIVEDVGRRIADGTPGERAVSESFAVFERALAELGGRQAERAADVADVARRVIAVLRGESAPRIPRSDRPSVLVAEELAPADAAVLDAAEVVGLVLSGGGPTSHTAIVARAKGIPAVLGVSGALDLAEGTVVIVDADAGTVVVDPPPAQAARIRGSGLRLGADLRSGMLADGTPLPLLANVSSLEEARHAAERGVAGVGLVRTEYLFAEAERAPGVEEQREAYLELLRLFPGRSVAVRVFDAGSDKPLRFMPQYQEGNPAIGMRGLRALRAEGTVLRDQLTALAAAQTATEARLRVYAPMVADAEEARWFVELARSFGIADAGVMAEVPSLALAAEQAMEVADFVSVGTNDLTQFAFAADRGDARLAGYQRPGHPAVLRLVESVTDAGSAAGKPVTVCGEAAADPALAVVFVGLGAAALSMTPPAIPAVREALAGVTLDQARARAAEALRAR